MATRAAAKATTPEPESKPKKSRLPVIVLALLILLAGGGAGAWYFMGQKAATGHEQKQSAEAAPPVFLPLDTFTVNLQPGDNGDQFLQIGITLQVADDKQVETLKQYMPNIRSRILLLLSSKKAADILTVDGKEKLAGQITDIFKAPLVPGAPVVNVGNVLFTSFVVQ